MTVVIHNSQPHNPWAMKSFFFKEGIEDEIINDLNNEVKQDDGILVRLNREKKNNKNWNIYLQNIVIFDKGDKLHVDYENIETRALSLRIL